MNLNRKKIAAAAAAALGTGGIALGLVTTASTAGAAVKPQPAATTTQITPDSPSAERSSETAPGVEAADEPGGNLLGGGHADPAGQNVDHQFEGVE